MLDIWLLCIISRCIWLRIFHCAYWWNKWVTTFTWNFYLNHLVNLTFMSHCVENIKPFREYQSPWSLYYILVMSSSRAEGFSARLGTFAGQLESFISARKSENRLFSSIHYFPCVPCVFTLFSVFFVVNHTFLLNEWFLGWEICKAKKKKVWS